MNLQTKKYFLLLSVLCLSACSWIWGGDSGRTSSIPLPFVHTVAYPGETLSAIARWYTGSARNWKYLAKAKSSGSNTVLKINDKVLIPLALVKNWAQPTRKNLVRFGYTPKKNSSQRARSVRKPNRVSTESPTEEQDINLEPPANEQEAAPEFSESDEQLFHELRVPQ